MAEVKLEAGATFDLASGTELRELGEKLADHIDALNDDPTYQITGANVQADASGNLGGGLTGPGLVVFRAPSGTAARLVRYSATSPTATPAAPLNTGWWALYRDTPNPAGLLAFAPPQGGAVAPIVVSEGRTDAILIRDGGTVIVIGAALPANQALSFGFQVELIAGNRTGKL